MTNDQLLTLAMPWPVERQETHTLDATVTSLVAEGLMYVEYAGNGWNRIGLTSAGRIALRAADDRDGLVGR